MITASIQLKGVEFALFSANLRRISQGRTGQMCALSEAPLIRVDCNTDARIFDRMRDASIKSSRLTKIVRPMDRGHIGRVIQRTRDRHGLKEINKTFGVGLRTLQAENLHILNGGVA